MVEKETTLRDLLFAVVDRVELLDEERKKDPIVRVLAYTCRLALAKLRRDILEKISD